MIPPSVPPNSGSVIPESFDFQTKVREQQEANRKGKSPFATKGKIEDALIDAGNHMTGSKDVKQRQALDLNGI